jgi:hypothetical protein
VFPELTLNHSSIFTAVFTKVDALNNPQNRRGVIHHALSTRTGRNKLRPYKKQDAKEIVLEPELEAHNNPHPDGSVINSQAKLTPMKTRADSKNPPTCSGFKPVQAAHSGNAPNTPIRAYIKTASQ